MNSIFDDKKLLAELIKSAVDHEVKFNKHGQVAADARINTEWRNYLTLTQKLSNQLRNKYFPKAPDSAVVSTATGKDAALGVPELSSLGNFLDFIVNNQIMVDGKRVAYGAGEQNPDPRFWLPVTAEQVKFMMETQTAEGERTQFQADYYVNRDLLVKYITHILRENSKQDESTQRFTKTMLGARIEDINRVFKTKLTTDYKEPEKVLPDTTEVDRFPKTVENFKNLAQAGEVPLLYGDIKSIETLNGWLGKNGIGHKTGNQIVTIKDQDFDLCGMINYMFGRATLLYQRRTSESGPIMQAYMSKMTAIAKQASCELTQPGGKPGQQPGQGQPGTGSQITPRALVGLATLRPFNTQHINFQELETFLTKYLEIKPQVAPLVGQVRNAMQLANGVLKSPGMPLDTSNLNAQQVRLWTDQPLQLLNYLHTIISVAGGVYTDFVTECRNVLKDMRGGDSILRSVEEQVTDGGPQKVNLWAIQRVMSTIQSQPQGKR